MKFLLDLAARQVASKHQLYPHVVAGHLITPGDNRKPWPGIFAIDNFAFTRFDRDRFLRLLKRNRQHRDRCLFVAVPDVVGSARRTLEVFEQWSWRLEGWPLALVAQDGQEDLPIPWELLKAVFIGGSTEFKESKAAADVVKAAQLIGLHVHIGRVNTVERFQHFHKMGADTCDGSGVCICDWKLEAIAKGETKDRPLFNGVGDQDGDGRDEVLAGSPVEVAGCECGGNGEAVDAVVG